LSASSLDRGGNHVFQQNLKRHRVPTALMGDEELTVALKSTLIKGYMMIIVVAVKGQFELVEAEAISFLGIPLGFLDLSDHSRIHLSISFRI
jgi:hypothetical protein